jgi:hypothetical protein
LGNFDHSEKPDNGVEFVLADIGVTETVPNLQFHESVQPYTVSTAPRQDCVALTLTTHMLSLAAIAHQSQMGIDLCRIRLGNYDAPGLKQVSHFTSNGQSLIAPQRTAGARTSRQPEITARPT